MLLRLISLGVASVLLASMLQAQQPPIQRNAGPQVVKTFYFTNLTQPVEIQEVMNAFRTILELSRITPIQSQSAISVGGTPEQIALAEKLVADIDRPSRSKAEHATYRLEFILSEFESGKKVNTRSYQLVAHSNGELHSARVGSRVQIGEGHQHDIGVAIDAKLKGSDDDLAVEGTIEVSGVTVPPTAPDGHTYPMSRQSKVGFDSGLTLGKQATLASLDEVDSPRRLQIDVTATKVK